MGIGDTVHFKANSLPGHDFIGLVSRSSKSLNNTFRSETMEIDVENTEGQFKPGMYAEVSFKTKSNIASFVVPRGAIVTTTERKYIIVVSDNVTKQVDVSEGIQSGDSVEIFGSVKIGDEVISDANYQIQDGLKIR